nr:unnamed protein product [Callosobruchus analis]
MEMENINVNAICRTCKCITPHMRSIFEEFENTHQSPRIDEMLMACASVQVMCGDGLPSLMCQVCLEQLKNAFVFKRQAEKVDAGLREYAKNLKVNEIKQELQNSEFMESLNTLNSILNVDTTPKSMAPSSTTTAPEEVKPLAPAQPKIEMDYIQFLENNQMLLTCRECAKIFTTLEGLRCHKRIHSGGMYKCKQCDKEYTRLNHLQRHELSHSRRKVHVCRICSKTLTRMEHLKRHLVTHLREKPFSCKTCNRGFNRIEHLHHHAPDAKGDTVFPCDVCNKAFNREDSLEVHKKMHDNQQPKLPTIENLDNIKDYYYQIDQDINTTFSDNDDAISDTDDYFEPHVEVTETGFDEDNKEKVADEINACAGENQDVSVQGSSGEGAAVAVEEESMSDDGSQGGDDMGGACDMGGDEPGGEDSEPEEGGEQAEADRQPVDEEEEEDEKKDDVKLEDAKLIQALLEDDQFNPKEAEEDENENSDANSEDSDYVPKKVQRQKRGRGRPRRNPDAPPKTRKPRGPGKGRGRQPRQATVKKEKDEEFGEFPCPACGEMFNTITGLDKHARIAHEGLKVIGEKKYECPICHKAFTTEKYRDVHVAAHNGTKEYGCKICEKTFLSKSHLTEHMKFHNDHSKKFLCSECGQRFIRNDYLVIHMRRHRGEKPFKCKFCGKGNCNNDIAFFFKYQ